MKTISCQEVGMDCDFVARGETDEEVFKEAARHAREGHQLVQIPDDIEAKMRSLIRDDGKVRKVA